MPLITISQATHDLLAAHSPSGRLAPGGSRVLDDGRIEVHVDEDVYDALARLAPDMDEAIRMACTHQYGRDS